MHNIAIISNSYLPNIWNGHGRSTFSVADSLSALGHDVRVFTFSADLAKLQEPIHINQCIVHNIGVKSKPVEKIAMQASTLPFGCISEWNQSLYKQLIQHSFSHIILIGPQGWEAANQYRAKKNCKIISFIPFLHTFQGWFNKLDQLLEDEMLNRENECVFNSDTLVTHTLRFGNKLANYANRDVNVIMNCYQNLYQGIEEDVEKIPGQICFVGKANREKSLERIIRVMPDIPDTTLVIASSNNAIGYLGSIYNLAKSLDIEHRVQIIGFKPTREIRKIYKASSVAIVPSQFEPYGFGAIDPMSLGIPVVASEWSCLDEYLGSKEYTFNSLVAFTDKLRNLLSLSSEDKDRLITYNKGRIEHELCIEEFGRMAESIL